MENKALLETIHKIRKGDKPAFRRLVEEYQQAAYRLSFRILCDEEEAQDAVQESFIKVWMSIGTFNMSKKFTTWIYRIFTNTALDKYRSRKRRNHAPMETVPEKIAEIYDAGFENDYHNREMAALIQAVSGGLPETQRIVFILRDIEGLDSEEVEVILGMKEDSVKSNLYHARKAIREKISRIIAYERRIR